jgi:hypothetical protein
MGLKNRIQRDQNCSGVAAPTAQSGSDGNALANLDTRTELQTGMARIFVCGRCG